MTSHVLAYLTRDEIAERVSAGVDAILPIGATEQHGPHLPLGTDNLLAEALSLRVAERLDAVMLPTVPFGYSYVWRDIGGTVTVRHRVLEDYLLDVFRSVERTGFRRLIIINGHESNVTTMKYVVRDYSEVSDFPIVRIFYPGYVAAFADVCESDDWYGMFHACEFETSLMLAAHPELVDMSKAVREYPAASDAYRFGAQQLGELSASGVFGDATKASAEKGEALMAGFVDEIVRVVEGSAQWPQTRRA